MSKVKVLTEVCKGCALCVTFCPKKVLELSKTNMNKKGYHVAEAARIDDCVGCAICGRMCPDVAIVVED